MDVALENKQADLVKQELAAFAAMVRESPEWYTAFLANPSIARAAKHSAIEQLVARMDASRTCVIIFFVIVDQRRMGCWWKLSKRSAGCWMRAGGSRKPR